LTYNFCINDFEGPLDLLLHLVKSSEMDIYEIKTTVIIEEYLNFISTMQEKNIDVASSYLVMAAELIHLKSKMLLNINDEPEENDEYSINSEEDLKQKLIEYEKYKNATESFKELELNRMDYYTKLPENLSEYMEEPVITNSDVTIDDLVNAFLAFKDRLKAAKPVNTRITKKELSVSERIANIRDILKVKKKINFVDLFDIVTKEYVVVTFLSILNMSKNNEVIIEQENNFSPITIESREF